jgi:hypothetical protein
MNEENKKRIITKLDEGQCLQPLDCGYLHFWPASWQGAFSADALRVIADELDRRNADWDKQFRVQSEEEVFAEITEDHMASFLKSLRTK